VLGRVGGSKGRSVAHAKSGSVTVLVVPVLVVPMLVLPVLGVPVRSYQCWSVSVLGVPAVVEVEAV